MAREYIEQRDGNYYVAGARISLDSIVLAFHRGESPETISQNFELLRLEEVYGAIAYYLANRTEIDAYLLRQSEKWSKENATPNHCQMTCARDSCAHGKRCTPLAHREGSISGGFRISTELS